MAEGLTQELKVICRQCDEELVEGLCYNSGCPECDWYDPPCPECGVQMSWSRENTRMCKEMTCSESPWYDPFIEPLPQCKWDDPLYKRAYRERLWRCVDRLIWTNPGITFREIREIMNYRMGAFRDKDSFSSSMQSRISNKLIVRYRRGWRFAKPPYRSYWQDGEILEIAGIELD